jgi:uncharacterized protein with FMN-binding domain
VRRLTLWLVSTASALVLLFSYHTSAGGSGGTQTAALGSATPGGTSSSSAATPAPSATGSTSPESTSTSGSFTGDSVDTRWGPVQVEITVANGRITDAQAVVYPSENGRDQEINSYALPVLHDEVLQAQNAQIDAVSGATVTSDGYTASLQSAIDAANLGG